MNNTELISGKLRRLRKARKLTQREAAKQIGLSERYLSEIECGRVPSIQALIRLADFYNVPISYMFVDFIHVDDHLPEDQRFVWMVLKDETISIGYFDEVWRYYDGNVVSRFPYAVILWANIDWPIVEG